MIDFGPLRALSPEFMALLLLLPLAWVFFRYVDRSKATAIAKFSDPKLFARLSIAADTRRIKLKRGLLALVLLLMLLALLRPQFGTRKELRRRRGLDIVFVIDTSKSMMAEDIKPNRLRKAKHEIGRFIDKLTGDRVALVAFAGTSFVQCPLTLDYNTARLFLDIMNTDLLPVPGTRVADAIETATDAFMDQGKGHKVIILLTDGESHEGDSLAAAEEAAARGIKIFTIGIGSEGGVPIPVYENQRRVGYKRDSSGQIITTKLDELTLEKIALATDGRYFRITDSGDELAAVFNNIAKMEKKELNAQVFTAYQERFQPLLFLALVALIAEFLISDRRKRQQHRIWEEHHARN